MLTTVSFVNFQTQCQEFVQNGFISAQRQSNLDFTSASLEVVWNCTEDLFLHVAQTEAELVSHASVFSQFEQDVEEVKAEVVNTSKSQVSLGLECEQATSLHKNIVEDFHAVWNIFSGSSVNRSNLMSALDSFLSSVRMFLDSSARFSLIQKCFSFEKYFWWRMTRLSDCYVHTFTVHHNHEGKTPFVLHEAATWNLLREVYHNFSLYCPEEDNFLVDPSQIRTVDPTYLPAQFCSPTEPTTQDPNMPSFGGGQSKILFTRKFQMKLLPKNCRIEL